MYIIIVQFLQTRISYLSFRAEFGSKRGLTTAIQCHGIAIRWESVQKNEQRRRNAYGFLKKLSNNSKVKLKIFEIENRKFFRSKIFELEIFENFLLKLLTFSKFRFFDFPKKNENVNNFNRKISNFSS